MKILFGARAFSGFFIYRETVFPSNASSGELRALPDKTSKILNNLIGYGVVILYAILLWLFPKMMTPIGMVASWGATSDRSLVAVLSILIWFASFAVLLVLHEALHMLAAVLVRWKVELLAFLPYSFRDRMKKTLPTACVRVHDTPSKRWKYILVYLLPFFVLTVLPVIAMLILQRVHWFPVLAALLGISSTDLLLAGRVLFGGMPRGALLLGVVWILPDAPEAQVARIRCMKSGEIYTAGWRICGKKVTPLARENWDEKSERAILSVEKWFAQEKARLDAAVPEQAEK